MLKESPSRSAPGQCSGAAGMHLFCMLRTEPEAAASRKLLRSCSGTWWATTLSRCACSAPDEALGSLSPWMSTRQRTCALGLPGEVQEVLSRPAITEHPLQCWLGSAPAPSAHTQEPAKLRCT